jgi:hypothetical protein
MFDEQLGEVDALGAKVLGRRREAGADAVVQEGSKERGVGKGYRGGSRNTGHTSSIGPDASAGWFGVLPAGSTSTIGTAPSCFRQATEFVEIY